MGRERPHSTGGVDHPYRAGPQIGVAGQGADRVLEQGQGGAQPLVVAGLAGHVGEGAGQVRRDEPQPAGLGADSEQDLGHRQGQRFGIGQLRRAPEAGRFTDPVVDLHVQCGQKGVDVCRHKQIVDTLRRSRIPNDLERTRLGGLGNNAVCSCGSGKKRKRCHGAH